MHTAALHLEGYEMDTKERKDLRVLRRDYTFQRADRKFVREWRKMG